ncbi:MAG TPA: ABC transporter ATP-binding protein [Pyrinomonadaceae bacterium]|jgi:lipopolysaccharide transport system ATP-binding protein
MKPIIRVQNVSKRYRIGARQEPYTTLRDTLVEAVRAPLKRLRRRRNGADNTVWALKGVSFTVEPGEVVGIVGRNGAGKSTLLKILSRITEPTTGQIDLYGRVGSLLEVGTGFNPELTGRENAYLSGTILGMRRSEVARKFDEIVAFAEIEKFIDTPVKHYSSGMYMRLAFAVAAHLEPEILLVDEVLAVGDAAFQKKCLGKMGDVAKAGRTVLFVSHNMTAVNQLCSSAVMLADGQIVRQGETGEVVAEYLKMGSESGGERLWPDPESAPGDDQIRLHAIRVISQGEVTADVDIDKEVLVEVEFWSLAPESRNILANIYLLDSMGTIVLSTANAPSANLLQEDWFDQPHAPGLYRATCTLPANFLNDDVYYITVYMVSLGPIVIHAQALQALSFKVFDTGVMRQAGGGSWAGVVRVRLPWRTEMLGPIKSEARSN